MSPHGEGEGQDLDQDEESASQPGIVTSPLKGPNEASGQGESGGGPARGREIL